jgi:polysaccharide pyruvyl transferase WcaK-like protein
VKVLILNSDSPNNRGDRAILQGLITLLKDLHPNAEITSLSQFADRDANWFGIRFLPFSPYSTSPVDYLKLLAEARGSDVVLWGGGELLKDYTNKLSLFYWALKLFGVKLVNSRIIGAFQGIGPTGASISKWAIKQSVNQTKVFLVRDQESKTKLDSWGVKSEVVASFDPAVYGNYKFDSEEFVGLGLRRWFHYRQSGWLPAKYRFWQKTQTAPSPKEQTYINQIVKYADWVTEQGLKIKFIPMHMSKSEDDAGFAEQIRTRMKNPAAGMVIARDNLSPTELLAEIASCKFFVASRLHSAILATLANVPSICLYYVDKGRLFFDQVGQSRFSRPIEIMTEPGASKELRDLTQKLLDETEEVREQQRSALANMRTRLRADLDEALKQVMN